MNTPRDGETPMQHLNVRIPAEIRRRLEQDAKQQRRTVSDTARLIIVDYYAQRDAQGEKG